MTTKMTTTTTRMTAMTTNNTTSTANAAMRTVKKIAGMTVVMTNWMTKKITIATNFDE